MQSALYLAHLHRSTQMDEPIMDRENNPGGSVEERVKNKTWISRLSYFLRNSSSTETPSSRIRSRRPTANEVNQWAQSFEKLLSSKYGLAAFQIFLKSEFCEENLEFWLVCEEFKRTRSPAKLASRANAILEEFVRSEAPKEVNLDFDTKNAIIRSAQQPDSSCFVKAQKKIYSLMENSSYPRFMESEIYKELCAAAKPNV